VVDAQLGQPSVGIAVGHDGDRDLHPAIRPVEVEDHLLEPRSRVTTSSTASNDML
jgi:hypothetical protein